MDIFYDKKAASTRIGYHAAQLTKLFVLEDHVEAATARCLTAGPLNAQLEHYSQVIYIHQHQLIQLLTVIVE